MTQTSALRTPGPTRTRGLSPKVGALAAALAAAALGFGGSPAAGCSCAGPGPHWGFLGPDTGRLPANAAGVLWYLPEHWQGKRSAEEIDRLTGNLTAEIRRAAGFLQIPVEVSRYSGPPTDDQATFAAGRFFLVAPAEGFRPGKTYRFTDNSDEEWESDWPAHGHRQVVFFVDRQYLERDTPLELELTSPAMEELRIAAGASCSDTRGVSNVQAAAELPIGADDWRDQLLYRTLIDDRVWVGKSSLCQVILPGRSLADEAGRDTIYSACIEETERDRYWSWARGFLEPSTHTLTMQAFLPGTDIVLETETVTIDLSCPGAGK